MGLCNLFLSDGSVNTFLQKHTRMQQQKNGVFDVVHAKELKRRQLGQSSSVEWSEVK
jgi:hypothetical protein